MSSILVSLASSHDNTDRATVGSVVAGAASGQDTTVSPSAAGAWLGTKGEADKICEGRVRAAGRTDGRFRRDGRKDHRLQPVCKEARHHRGRSGRWIAHPPAEPPSSR
jgi:hypothetical protein